MAERCVVIADAGPLIALSRVGSLSLLQGIFGPVWITENVRREVCDVGCFAGQDLIAAALSAGVLLCVTVDLAHWQPRFAGVDEGEASSIMFAESVIMTQGLDVLLIVDDRLGRLEAQARGLAIIGTAGVIGLAKMRGLIPRAGEVLLAIRGNGYFLGDDVARAILDRVGE